MLSFDNFSITRPIFDPKMWFDRARQELKPCLNKESYIFDKFELF